MWIVFWNIVHREYTSSKSQHVCRYVYSGSVGSCRLGEYNLCACRCKAYMFYMFYLVDRLKVAYSAFGTIHKISFIIESVPLDLECYEYL